MQFALKFVTTTIETLFLALPNISIQFVKILTFRDLCTWSTLGLNLTHRFISTERHMNSLVSTSFFRRYWILFSKFYLELFLIVSSIGRSVECWTTHLRFIAKRRCRFIIMNRFDTMSVSRPTPLTILNKEILYRSFKKVDMLNGIRSRVVREITQVCSLALDLTFLRNSALTLFLFCPFTARISLNAHAGLPAHLFAICRYSILQQFLICKPFHSSNFYMICYSISSQHYSWRQIVVRIYCSFHLQDFLCFRHTSKSLFYTSKIQWMWTQDSTKRTRTCNYIAHRWLWICSDILKSSSRHIGSALKTCNWKSSFLPLKNMGLFSYLLILRIVITTFISFFYLIGHRTSWRAPEVSVSSIQHFYKNKH